MVYIRAKFPTETTSKSMRSVPRFPLFFWNGHKPPFRTFHSRVNRVLNTSSLDGGKVSRLDGCSAINLFLCSVFFQLPAMRN